MSIVLEPAATIYIQRTATPPTPDPLDTSTQGPQVLPAFTFRAPNSDQAGGFPFTAKVEQAVASHFGLAVLTLEVPGLKPEEVDAIPVNALIRVDAGYRRGGPAERPIFFGVMQQPLPNRAGGLLSYKITAVSQPTVLFSSRILYHGAGIPIGIALEDLCARLRLPKPVLPPEAYGRITTQSGEVTDPQLLAAVTLEDYTPIKSFLEEVNDLIARLADAAKKPFTQVPNHTNPFQIVVVDLNGSSPIERLTIDLASPLIHEAHPTPVEASLLAPPTADGTQDPTDFTSKTYIKSFYVQQAFDPRVSLAQLVAFSGDAEGQGAFVIDQVTHELFPNQPWTSTYEGPFLFGSKFNALPDAGAAQQAQLDGGAQEASVAS